MLLHKLLFGWLFALALVLVVLSGMCECVCVCVLLTVTNNLFTLYFILQLRPFSVLSVRTQTHFLGCIKDALGVFDATLVQREYNRQRAVYDASPSCTVTTHTHTRTRIRTQLEPLRDVRGGRDGEGI